MSNSNIIMPKRGCHAMLSKLYVNLSKHRLILCYYCGIFTNYCYELLKLFLSMSNCHVIMSKCRFNLFRLVLICQIVELLKRFLSMSNCHVIMSKYRFNLFRFVLLCQIVILSCRNVVVTCLKSPSFCQSVISFCQGSVLIRLNIVLLWRSIIFSFQMWCLLVTTHYHYAIQWR
jgi:hypothetical protein